MLRRGREEPALRITLSFALRLCLRVSSLPGKETKRKQSKKTHPNCLANQLGSSRAYPSRVCPNQEVQSTGPGVRPFPLRTHAAVLSSRLEPLCLSLTRNPSTKPPQGLPGCSLALGWGFWGSWFLPAEVRVCLASHPGTLPPFPALLPPDVPHTGVWCPLPECLSVFSPKSLSVGWASFWQAPFPAGWVLTIPHPKHLSAVPMDRTVQGGP